VEWKWVVLVLSVVSFVVGRWVNFPMLGDVQTVDFFPLFPWIGMVGMGVFLGHFFYPKGVQRFEWKFLNRNGYAKKSVCFLGRHSLVIYMTHVPLIMAVLWMMGLVKV
jgi:uncharacterized membrane protein